MPTQLTHFRLLVEQYGPCFRFYRDRLGFEPTFGDASSGYADFDTGDVTLALFDATEMSEAIGSDPTLDRGRDTAMVVLGVDDVEETYAEIGDDVGVAGPTDHPEWGIRTAHLRDPDGTLVEINEPLE